MKLITFFSILLFFSFFSFSQNPKDTVQTKLKISGYVQAQFQYFTIADTTGSVSSNFAYFNGGNFPNRFTRNRFMVRRGRLKFAHKTENTEGVLSLDFTERGFGIKDLYAKCSDPWIKMLSLTGGIFNRPFGYEIEQSSSLRESLERSRVIQTLFPNERDLGIKVSFMGKEEMVHRPFIDLAIINGNGAAVETDNYKDFIARIGITNKKNKPEEKQDFEYRLGFSCYNGFINHIYEPVDTVSSNTTTKYYIFKYGIIIDTAATKTVHGFIADTVASKATGTRGGKVIRNYYGIDAEVSFKSPFGKISIKGEYIWGTQPASLNAVNLDKEPIIYNYMNSMSPTGPFMGVSWNIYDSPQPYNPVGVSQMEKYHNTFIRKFNGAHISITQDIMETKHKVVIKYDWYDPNTEISGKDIDLVYYKDTLPIGKTRLSPADIKYTTIGIGWIYDLDDHFRISAYYDYIENEKTKIKPYKGDLKLGFIPSPGFLKDVSDNAITVRIQYKF